MLDSVADTLIATIARACVAGHLGIWMTLGLVSDARSPRGTLSSNAACLGIYDFCTNSAIFSESLQRTSHSQLPVNVVE